MPDTKLKWKYAIQYLSKHHGRKIFSVVSFFQNFSEKKDDPD